LFLEGAYEIKPDTKTEGGFLGDTSHITKRVFLRKSILGTITTGFIAGFFTNFSQRAKFLNFLG
jgi:hypothetical protein